MYGLSIFFLVCQEFDPVYSFIVFNLHFFKNNFYTCFEKAKLLFSRQNCAHRTFKQKRKIIKVKVCI